MDSESIASFSRRFSILAAPLAPDALVVRPDGVEMDDFRWLHGDAPKNPVPIRYAMGHRLGDLVLGGGVGFLLISPRFMAALESTDCTGWTTYPVSPTHDLATRLQGYRGLAVNGRCLVDDALSSKVLEPPLLPGGDSAVVFKGLYFKPSSWDGSDVFVSPGLATVFLTEKARSALAGAKLQDVEFRPLHEAYNYGPALAAGEFG